MAGAGQEKVMQVSWKGSAGDDPGPVQVTAVQVEAARQISWQASGRASTHATYSCRLVDFREDGADDALEFPLFGISNSPVSAS